MMSRKVFYFIVCVFIILGALLFFYQKNKDIDYRLHEFMDVYEIRRLAQTFYNANLSYDEMDKIATKWYKAKGCVLNNPKSKFLMVVPVKDRRFDLLQFILYMPNYFCRQGVKTDILIIEQNSKGKFNKGILFNAGFLEVDKANANNNKYDRLHGYDCFALQDIDKLPGPSNVPYVCKSGPHCLVREIRHEHGVWKIYGSFLGGVVMFTREQYEKVNGVSTYFLGWGCEDDDLWNRVKLANMTVFRPPYDQSIFCELGFSHKRDVNPDRHRLLKELNNYESMMGNGLHQTSYKLLERRDFNTFVWLNISF